MLLLPPAQPPQLLLLPLLLLPLLLHVCGASRSHQSPWYLCWLRELR
jgi:hypothetical protein